MTLLCISSVATCWPAARSLLVMITFAPAAASTLTVSLPIPTGISTKFNFDVQVTITDRIGYDGCTCRCFSAKVMLQYMGYWFLTVTGKSNSYIEGLGWAGLGWVGQIPNRSVQTLKRWQGTH